MKFALASDLHLEFKKYLPKKVEADVLVLAGDIFCASLLKRNDDKWKKYKKNFFKFFDHVSPQYKHILYVMGNHEHYRGDFHYTKNILLEGLQNYSNVVLLDNDIFKYEDVTFIGSTLWTSFDNDPIASIFAQQRMSDFSGIIRFDDRKYLSIDSINEHDKCLSYIKNVVAEKDDEKFVVVTHHSPSYQSVAEKYRGQLLNGAYHSNLDEFIMDKSQIKVWCHGHTHDYFDYRWMGTRIVCNPRGYPGEYSHLVHNLKIIEI